MKRSLSDSALRHRATKCGYYLHKSRSINSIVNQGGYMIGFDDCIVAGEHYDMSPEDVDMFLSECEADNEIWDCYFKLQEAIEWD